MVKGRVLVFDSPQFELHDIDLSKPLNEAVQKLWEDHNLVSVIITFIELKPNNVAANGY